MNECDCIPGMDGHTDECASWTPERRAAADRYLGELITGVKEDAGS